MKKKMVYVTAGIITGTLMFSGCGDDGKTSDEKTSGKAEEVKEGKDDVVELTYTSRGNADEIKVYQQAVDAFNESQDEIHVTFEASPSDGYSQQLITQLAGGTAADIIFVEDTSMSQLVKNGTVANMKDFLASDESYVKEEDFDEGVWGAARTEDGVWGLSVDCNPMVLYYSP